MFPGGISSVCLAGKDDQSLLGHRIPSRDISENKLVFSPPLLLLEGCNGHKLISSLDLSGILHVAHVQPLFWRF